MRQLPKIRKPCPRLRLAVQSLIRQRLPIRNPTPISPTPPKNAEVLFWEVHPMIVLPSPAEMPSPAVELDAPFVSAEQCVIVLEVPQPIPLCALPATMHSLTSEVLFVVIPLTELFRDTHPVIEHPTLVAMPDCRLAEALQLIILVAGPANIPFAPLLAARTSTI